MADGDESSENGVDRDDKGRWLPGGRSPNPKGRPKFRVVSELIRDRLQDVHPEDEEGRTYAEILADKAVALALMGKTSDVHALLDRVEGKPRQTIQINPNRSEHRADLKRMSSEDLRLYMDLLQRNSLTEETSDGE